MKREIRTLQTNLTPAEVMNITAQYFTQQGFKNVNYKNEGLVWKKGGLMVVPQYVIVTPQEGSVTVQAFIRHILLPGVEFGEDDLSGLYALAIKAVLKDRIDTFCGMLNNAAYNKHEIMNNQAANAQPTV